MGKDNKSLPILTKENHEDWFRRAQVKIKGKAVWFAITTLKQEYAWVPRVGGAADPPPPPPLSNSEPRNNVEDLRTQFERMGGTWSVDQERTWDIADAKALEVMLNGLGSDDATLVDEYQTAKAVWEQLKIKYEKTSITTVNTYMTALQNFVYDKEVGMDSSWTKLKEYRRKLVAADASMKTAYPDTSIFLILTVALRRHQEYSSILDGFLTQQSLTTDEKLKILMEKEDQLKGSTEEKAHAAWRHNKGLYRKTSHNRRNSNDSDMSMKDSYDECFCCGGTDHFAAKCEFREASREYAKGLRLRKESGKEPKPHRKSYHRKSKHSNAKGKTSKRNPKSSSKGKKQGHAAIHDSSTETESSESSEYDSDPDDQPSSEEDEPVEKVMLSKESIRKSTPKIWALDTGASSHMTDQIHLFRTETLVSTAQVPIQVGGGHLYSTKKGTAKVDAKDKSSGYLENVLYVPKLGVNLISAKKLCKGGLTGTFDDENIWITRGNKEVLEAKQSKGLYVVNKISEAFQGEIITGKNAREQAMPAAEASDNELTDIDPDDLEPELATTKEQRRWYRLMHRRFGHCGPNMLRKLHKVTSLRNPIRIPPPHRRVCAPCKLAKMRNLTRKQLAKHKKEKLELVYMDIAGPLPKSLRSNRYFLQIIDSATRRNWSIPLPSKDEAIPAIRKWRNREELATNKKLKSARTDNAPELKQILEQLEREDGVQAQFTTIASSNQNGPVERSIQTAENTMRAMLKAQDLPLEFWDEAVEADAYVRNIQPTGPIMNGKPTSPIQAYTGKEPDISHIRVWGSKAYAYINPKTRHKDDRHDKLVLRGREGVFMGYSDDTDKHFKMYAPDLGYTTRSSRLNVDESVCGGTVDLRLRNCISGPQGTPIEVADRRGRGRPRKDDAPVIAPATTTATQFIPQTKPVVEIPTVPRQDNIPEYEEDDQGNLRQVHKVKEPETIQTQEVVTNQDPPVDSFPPPGGLNEQVGSENTPGTLTPQEGETQNLDEPMEDAPTGRYYFRERPEKRKRDIDDEGERKAKVIRAMVALILASDTCEEMALVASQIPQSQLHVYGEELSKEIESAFLTIIRESETQPTDKAMAAKVVNGISIPRTYKEAINDSKHATEWTEAIQEEIQSLIANGTWEEFILPKGANLVSTKWVFDVKKSVTGETERFKARLVARGFSQQYGVDYIETFAPTVRMDTLRMFLAMVAKEDLNCRQYDIKNAFTESHLKEQIFLEPPQGLAVKKGHVLRALRSLYGLKQAGRNWSLLLKEFLLSIKFTQSLADPCLYIHHERQIYLLVYVDDIPAAARSNKQLDWFFKELNTRFNAKDLGEIHKILGVRITRDRKHKTIYMDQENYLKSVCDSLGITQGKYKMRTTPANNLDSLLAGRQDETPINAEQYARGVGQLMYGMVFTRPDIAFTLGRLSQHMKAPVERHGHALKWLLQYVKSTIKQKIRLGPGGAHSSHMGIYTDADWASDKIDRKSISGGAGLFYGGPFGWASKKQASVSTSSAESEYISQAMYAKFGQWSAQIWKDLGVPQYINSNQERTVQMYGDNQGALALVKNPQLHERSKHIDISHHYIRDLAEKGRLEITYIPTVDMIADGMTKPLPRVAHEKFRRQLGLVDEDTLLVVRDKGGL